MHALNKAGSSAIETAMRSPSPLHRFWQQQAKNLWAAATQVVAVYSGQVNRIWSGCPSSAAIIWRFLEFPGVGPKIATMATNILVRDLKVKVADKSSIDISVDSHIERVSKRIGLVSSDKKDVIIFRARDLCPDYPGVLDLPLWIIGREHCRPKNPTCKAVRSCPLYDLCQWDMKV